MPKEGLLRVALAGVVGLLLAGGWATGETALAYLAAILAAAFGGLLAVRRPRALLGKRLVHLLLDSLLITVLVSDTGGKASPFFALFFLAAVQLFWVQGFARCSAGTLALTGGYLTAALASAGGPWTALPPVVTLRAGLVALCCVVAGLVGAELRRARKRTQDLSSALAAERTQGEKVAALVASFGPALEVLDPEDILKWAAQTARDVLEVPYAHAATLKGFHHQTAIEGEPDASPSWWHPTVQKLVLWSCRTNEIQRSGETIHGIRGFIAVPLTAAEGEGVGALVVGGKQFGRQEERVLGLLAGGIATALERAEDAPGGRDPTSRLPNRASLQRVLESVLSQDTSLTILVTDVDRFRVYNDFYGPKGGNALLQRMGEELGRKHRRAFRHGDDEFVTILAGSNRARAREAARGIRQMIEKMTARSAVPLTASVGFVVAEPPHREPDAVLVAAFGALARAKEHPENIFGAAVNEALQALGGSLSGSGAVAETVSAFVEAAEVRDPYIGSHLRAVSRMALLLGSKMALSRSQMEVLAAGALLHDVGKIGIPDSVLLKPGRLTDEEIEVMKQHPVLGVRILESVEGLSSTLPVVRHHHERFDGRGYPDGLQGESIPLLARVVLVADAFDSMVRDRYYRRGTSREHALGEILRKSGTQFDPEVVRALTEVLEEQGNRQAGSA